MLGDNILKIREVLGLTQLQFADLIGAKSKSVVSNIERNVSEPSKLSYMKIQRRLGFSRDTLMNKELTLDDIESAVEESKKPQEYADLLPDEVNLRLIQLEASYKNLLLEVASIPGKRLPLPDDEVIERVKEKVEIDLASEQGK
jgi:transcriptional regulator with XRE-family HTH domain